MSVASQCQTLALSDGRQLSKVNEDTYTVTRYKGTPATKEQIASELIVLNKAFPQTTQAFIAVLAEQVASEGWTAERIHDAVRHMIRTCEHPTFTPAKFLNYDKKKNLYTYSGYCGMILRGRAEHADFGKVKINDRVFWYLINEQY